MTTADPGQQTETVLLEPRTRKQKLALALLSIAGVLANGLMFGPALWHTWHGNTDFMAFYAGGKLAFSNGLYDARQVLGTEMSSIGWSSVNRLYVRPPFEAALFWPLAHLPYHAASLVWDMLCAGAFVAFVVVFPYPRRWSVALACSWSLPVFLGLAQGQDTGFLLLTVAFVVRLLQKNRERSAGLVASLCAAKFHLFLMLPLWIIRRKQWRFASGAALGCVVLAFLSVAAGGFDWPLRYYRFLRDPANQFSPAPEIMPNLYGAFANTPHFGQIALVCVALIAGTVWAALRHTNAELGLASVITGGVLAAPHVYIADCALLIPAALIALENAESEWTRFCAVCLLTPIPYLLCFASSGSLRTALIRAALGLFLFALGWQAFPGRKAIQGWFGSIMEKKSFASAAVPGTPEP